MTYAGPEGYWNTEKFVRPAVSLLGFRVSARTEHFSSHSVGSRYGVPADPTL